MSRGMPRSQDVQAVPPLRGEREGTGNSASWDFGGLHTAHFIYVKHTEITLAWAKVAQPRVNPHLVWYNFETLRECLAQINEL